MKTTFQALFDRLPTSSIDLWKRIRRVFSLWWPYRAQALTAFVCSLLASVFMLAIPLGLRELIDSVLEEGRGDLLPWLAGGLLVLLLVRAVLGFVGQYYLKWTGERVVTDMRKRLYERVHDLGLWFHHNRHVGQLASRLTNDVLSVRTASTQAVVQLLTNGINLVGSIGLMLLLNVRLSLFAVAIIPAAALVAQYFGSHIRSLSEELQNAIAETTALAKRGLGAVKVVKSMGRQNYETSKYHDAAEELFETFRQRALARAIMTSGISLLFFSVLVGIFWYGGSEVLAGRLSAGDLIAFIFYGFNVAQSTRSLSGLYSSFNKAAGASERIFEIIDQPQRIRTPDDAVDPDRLDGHVLFDGVTFQYEDDHPILHDVTIDVPPGETVALVGPSGSGKSTIIQLVPRLYDPLEGTVRLDGYDLRTVRIEAVRDQISYVSQDIALFGYGSTLRDNIRYGRLDASDADIEDAARKAQAHDFIQRLPDGYDSEIGERGVKLSGGQRQRIAIARALVRDARILLLDEATSSLDSKSESKVQDVIDTHLDDRTTFVVAHRLATVKNVDRILVLDQGEVVDAGSHDELVRRDGLYREMAARQFHDVGGDGASNGAGSGVPTPSVPT